MKHQPRDDSGEFLGSKDRLIHRVQVRPDRLIMPPAKLDVESRQSGAHPRRRIPRLRRIVINMGVVALDHALAHKNTSLNRDDVLYYQIWLAEAKSNRDCWKVREVASARVIQRLCGKIPAQGTFRGTTE